MLRPIKLLRLGLAIISVLSGLIQVNCLTPWTLVLDVLPDDLEPSTLQCVEEISSNSDSDCNNSVQCSCLLLQNANAECFQGNESEDNIKVLEEATKEYCSSESSLVDIEDNNDECITPSINPVEVSIAALADEDEEPSSGFPWFGRDDPFDRDLEASDGPDDVGDLIDDVNQVEDADIEYELMTPDEASDGEGSEGLEDMDMPEIASVDNYYTGELDEDKMRQYYEDVENESYFINDDVNEDDSDESIEASSDKFVYQNKEDYQPQNGYFLKWLQRTFPYHVDSLLNVGQERYPQRQWGGQGQRRNRTVGGQRMENPRRLRYPRNRTPAPAPPPPPPPPPRYRNDNPNANPHNPNNPNNPNNPFDYEMNSIWHSRLPYDYQRARVAPSTITHTLTETLTHTVTTKSIVTVSVPETKTVTEYATAETLLQPTTVVVTGMETVTGTETVTSISTTEVVSISTTEVVSISTTEIFSISTTEIIGISTVSVPASGVTSTVVITVYPSLPVTSSATEERHTDTESESTTSGRQSKSSSAISSQVSAPNPTNVQPLYITLPETSDEMVISGTELEQALKESSESQEVNEMNEFEVESDMFENEEVEESLYVELVIGEQEKSEPAVDQSDNVNSNESEAPNESDKVDSNESDIASSEESKDTTVESDRASPDESKEKTLVESDRASPDESKETTSVEPDRASPVEDKTEATPIETNNAVNDNSASASPDTHTPLPNDSHTYIDQSVTKTITEKSTRTEKDTVTEKSTSTTTEKSTTKTTKTTVTTKTSSVTTATTITKKDDKKNKDETSTKILAPLYSNMRLSPPSALSHSEKPLWNSNSAVESISSGCYDRFTKTAILLMISCSSIIMAFIL